MKKKFAYHLHLCQEDRKLPETQQSVLHLKHLPFVLYILTIHPHKQTQLNIQHDWDRGYQSENCLESNIMYNAN